MIPDPAPPFEVDASGNTRDRIQRMLRRAVELGVHSEVIQSLADILQQLETDPRGWGDPLWRFHAAQMVQYAGSVHNLRCEYCVHDRIPTVVITNILPLLGSPLYGQGFDR